MLTGAGADVDHPVGDLNRVLIVLNYDDGVAQFAQANQRLNQSMVVPLMQADRWFVEHIEHANQTGADLRRETNALRLAARERAGGA